MDINIVFDCWARATPGFVYLPTQDRTRSTAPWHEGPRHHSRDRSESMFSPPEQHDQYFTPLSFDGDRKNENVLGPIHVLYADLDASHPGRLDISPSVAWETSPGSYQALWWLSEGVSVSRFHRLNKALTYHTGADKGGWHASKAIRVPGSINWKRGGQAGRVLWDTRKSFHPDWIEKQTKAGEGTLPSPVPDFGPPPPIPNEQPIPSSGVRVSTQWMMAREGDDRSVHLWKTIKALKADGLGPEDAFAMLWHTPCNKYRAEGRATRLWIDIQRAYND